MTGLTGPTPRGARFAHWANLYLFSLNLAWMTTAYRGVALLTLSDSWAPTSRLLEFLSREIRMSAPPIALFTVVCAYVLSLPIFLILLLMARALLTRTGSGALAGAFAIVGYPFFALTLTGYLYDEPKNIHAHEFGLLLETVAVLAGGVLYYLRRWPLSTSLSLLLLLVHFGLWAWVTNSYANPHTILILSYPYSWKVVPGIRIWLAISLSMMLHCGFPVIGFLSALSSGLDIRLSSGRLPHAVDLSVAKPVA